MAVIRSLKDTVGVLSDNTILFAVGLMMAALVLPQTLMSQIGVPVLPFFLTIATFFVSIFILAGLYAMAYEGLHRGSTSLETFKQMGKDRYLPLLGGTLIEVVIGFVFVFVASMILVFTVGFAIASAFSGSGGEPELAALTGGGAIVGIAIAGVVLLVYAVFMFFVQFYRIAIVVDKSNVIEGYKKSAALVRHNFLYTIGYSLINLGIAFLISLPIIVIGVVPIALAYSSAGPSSIDLMTSSIVASLGITAYSFVVQIFMVPFRGTFAVSFYDRHKPDA